MNHEPVATEQASEPSAFPWRPVVLQAAAMWLATRVALAVLTYVTVILNMSGNPRIPPGFASGSVNLGTLLGSWQRWDAGWFSDIALHGYATPESTAFFPGYPLLIHLGITITGPGAIIPVALLISNLAALIGFIGVGLLAAREQGPAASPAAIRALSAYPLAFFLAAPYSDALLLATASFALLFARQGWWARAALAAFLASFTRTAAVVLFLPLAYEYGRQHGWWERARWRGGRRLLAWRAWPPALLVLLGLPMGFAIYALYLWQRFDRPLLFLQAQAHWKRQAEPVWITLKHAVGLFIRVPFGTYWNVLIMVDLGGLLLFGVLAVLAARRQPVSFTLYMAGLLYVCVAAPILVLPDPLSSVGRVLLVSIPAFIFLSRWLRRWPVLDLLVVSAGFMLQAALATYFLSGGWVE